MSKKIDCPLCYLKSAVLYQKVDGKKYFICSNCDLVFLSDKDRLSKEEEKKRYDLHENDPDDKNYRKFLSKIFIPMQNIIAAPAKGLDYGSGPGPLLAQMFEEKGYSMKTYDPYYNEQEAVLEENYDFITCTEVVEHFYNPGQEFRKLINLLNEKGILGIMTETREKINNFETWHYRRDPTHVCFYSDKTFDWLSEKFNLQRIKNSTRVNIFKNSQVG